MQASPYFLPQHLSAARQRVRQAWLERVAPDYRLVPDSPTDILGDTMRPLPARVHALPSQEKFAPGVLATFLGQKFTVTANQMVGSARVGYRSRLKEKSFEHLFCLFNPPRDTSRLWRNDLEFARQRVAGVNPMHLRLCEELPAERDNPLWHEMARMVVESCETPGVWEPNGHKPAVFVADYSILNDPRILRYLKPGCLWATPRAWFWIDPVGRLRPLVIELLRTAPESQPEYYSPCGSEGQWLLARSFVQMADAVLHEGYYHLLETHLVGETIAACLYRTLHPDHPLHHLLKPHFTDTMAINATARGDLLSIGGPIDTAVGVGVLGTLNATRKMYAGWNWEERAFDQDIAARNMGPNQIAFYPYRDDVGAVSAAIRTFVDGMLSPYYVTDDDVRQDPELRAFTQTVADPEGGDIPGFPSSVETRDELFRLVTQIITRLSVQHAAVNNGQFDAYAYVPNSPTSLYGLPREGEDDQFWTSLPDRHQCHAQLGLVWVLSRPTRSTLLYAGESAAFSPGLDLRFGQAVLNFRRRLETISDEIELRNGQLDVPYVYCDPYNIARSVDI